MPEPLRIEPTLQTRSELAIWAHAVLDEGRSLMVWRHDTPTLITVCEALQAHWQAQAPTLNITHFSGHQPASLLGRINETLTQQGLHQAMQPGQTPAPPSIWLVHDAERFSNDELLLLLRINSQFPGWKIRWVLLFNVGVPLPSDKQALLQEASGGWLQWTTPAPLRALALRPEAKPPALISAVQQQLQKTSVELWAAGLVVLLALGVWLVLQNTTRTGTSPRPSPGPTSVAIAPTSTPVQGAPLPLAQAAAPELPSAQAQVQAQTAVSAPAPAPAPVSAPEPATAPTMPPVQQPAPAAAPEVTPPTMPEVAQRGLRWVKGLPRDSFLLEHGEFETAQQAQRLIRANDELGNARVLMRPGNGNLAPRYLVVTGPFRSEERAKNFMQRKRLPEQTRIEEVARILKKTAIPTPKPTSSANPQR